VLIDFLDPKQRLQIENYVDEAGGRHPAWSIMNAGSSTVSYERSPKDFLANEAVHFIKQDGNSETWFNNTLKRVAQTGDLEESASAIAEICCYGAMREAGFTVRAIRPASTPKPDFEFSLENTTGVIEVATKLAHDRRVRRVRQIADGETPPGVERSKFKISGTKITSLKAEVHPFGPPILTSWATRRKPMRSAGSAQSKRKKLNSSKDCQVYYGSISAILDSGQQY
jgi:hypothetical protein